MTAEPEVKTPEVPNYPVMPPSLQEGNSSLWSEDNTWSKLGSKRGVETIFRTSYQSHVELTSVADRKANILISVNGIIASVLLATVVPRIVGTTWLVIGTGTMLLTCIVTLSLAMLAALPRVSRRDISVRQVRRSTAQPLFFGHFVTMSRSDYEDAMLDVLHNRDLLYRNMIRDLHGMGAVLEKKYRLLRAAYLTFLTGMVLSVLFSIPSMLPA